MKHEFDMRDLDNMKNFLGLKIMKKIGEIFTTQEISHKVLLEFITDQRNFKLSKDEEGIKVDKKYCK